MLPFSFYLTYIKKLLSLGKKIIFVFVVFSTAILLLSYFSQKNKPQISSDPIKQNRAEFYKTINNPELQKTKQGKLTIALYRISACTLLGEACSNNPNDFAINFNRSILGSVTNLIKLPFQNPPASGVMWAYQGLQNSGFIPKAYAAEGIGFGVIKPFSGIWVAFRDVAYTILVLVIIASGFMIMFRMKLNPQTVISIENTLPKIVITLIYITFSFAIAGFLIDLMYLSIAILIGILGPAGGYDVAQYQQKFIQAQPWELLGGLTKEGSIGIWTILYDVPNALINLIPQLGAVLNTVAYVLGMYFIGTWAVNNPGRWLGGLLTTVFGFEGKAGVVVADLTLSLKDTLGNLTQWGWITPVMFGLAAWFSVGLLLPMFIGLILLLTLIFIFFRIFLMILDSYGKILLKVILAPIFLLFEAIPGQNAFSNWIKGLIAELIAFPVIIGMFIIGMIIMDKTATGNAIQFPFLVGIDPKSFSFIIGMALLFMTPDIVKQVKQILVPKPSALEQQAGIGVLFGGATTGISGGLGEVQKYAGLGYYFSPLGKLINAIPGLNKMINVAGPHGTQQHG